MLSATVGSVIKSNVRKAIPVIFILGSYIPCSKNQIMANKIPRGAFIVFEGCDRSGKTTQKKIVDYLNEHNVPSQFVNFPDRTTSTGQIINDYLRKKIELSDQAAHLIFSANRWEREPSLTKLINQGTTVICDRYSFSGVAFSAAKEGMDISWCFAPEKGLPKPDAVLLFSLNEEALSKREGFGDERYEVSDFQKKVAENFNKIKDNSWIDIDADKDIESLAVVVKDIVMDTIQRTQYKPLEKFV
uniref:Thymidylate kinase n=1 Tax=Cacopsylla melanoneura TaxID=428564 RepID=A0A8D8LMD0_9HEMI